MQDESHSIQIMYSEVTIIPTVPEEIKHFIKIKKYLLKFHKLLKAFSSVPSLLKGMVLHEKLLISALYLDISIAICSKLLVCSF